MSEKEGLYDNSYVTSLLNEIEALQRQIASLQMELSFARREEETGQKLLLES